MALINCSECNAQISDTAKSCPKCGAPVVKSESKVEEKRTPETVNNNVTPPIPVKKGKGLLIALIGVGLLILAVIAFLFLNRGPSKEEIEAREKAKADSVAAVLMAKMDSIAAAEAMAAEKAEMEERAMIVADSIAAALEASLNEAAQE